MNRLHCVGKNRSPNHSQVDIYEHNNLSDACATMCNMVDRQTDRHHYFKSSNIPKTEGVQILPYLSKQSYDLH